MSLALPLAPCRRFRSSLESSAASVALRHGNVPVVRARSREYRRSQEPNRGFPEANRSFPETNRRFPETQKIRVSDALSAARREYWRFPEVSGNHTPRVNWVVDVRPCMQETTRTDAPDRPERGADRNRRALTGEDAPTASDPVLPSLDDGVTLLSVDGRGVPVLQSLALDHLLTEDGPAFWVDTAGCARTTTLARVAPSWRLLERVHVARGFTPHQHHAAVADLPDAVKTRAATERSTPADATGTPALLVAPVVDGRYRDADDLPYEHARQLLARTLARLRRYADAYDAPVLLTRAGSGGNGGGEGVDSFADVVERAADHRLRCERTPQGPRFLGDDTETLVYPQPDGSLQTTLSYWRTVLDRRATAAGMTTDGPTPTATDVPDGIGTRGTGARGTGAVHDGAFATPTGDGRGHGAAHERALSPWRGDA